MVADGSAVGSNATDRALLDFLIGRSQLYFDTNTITEKQQFNSATKFAKCKRLRTEKLTSRVLQNSS